MLGFLSQLHSELLLLNLKNGNYNTYSMYSTELL